MAYNRLSAPITDPPIRRRARGHGGSQEHERTLPIPAAAAAGGAEAYLARLLRSVRRSAGARFSCGEERGRRGRFIAATSKDTESLIETQRIQTLMGMFSDLESDANLERPGASTGAFSAAGERHLEQQEGLAAADRRWLACAIPRRIGPTKKIRLRPL